jgi:hypothetical protein
MSVHPDCEGGPHWARRVGRLLRHGLREEVRGKGARDYFRALKVGHLKVLREQVPFFRSWAFTGLAQEPGVRGRWAARESEEDWNS